MLIPSVVAMISTSCEPLFLQIMANVRKRGRVVVNTETIKTETCSKDFVVHLNGDFKVEDSIVLMADRNVSQKPNLLLRSRKLRLSNKKHAKSSIKRETTPPQSECQDKQNQELSPPSLCPVQCSYDKVCTSATLSSNYDKISGVLNTSVVSSLPLNITSKKVKGRPKKSICNVPTKKNIQEPYGKKAESPSSFKKPADPLGENNTETSALTLAKMLGFEKPYEKITVKSSGNDKEGEVTKQTSPIEIIQQMLDYKKSCECSCLADINMLDIISHRLEVTLLDRHARDFFIMGLLRSGAVTFKETYLPSKRSRNRFSYRLMNTKICHCCFLAVNNIGGKYLKNLKRHFAIHGVTSRLHGNLGRKPYHAINSSDITDVVEFVNRYAASSGVPSARHHKNNRAERIIRLPISDNFTSVHKKYKDYNEHTGKRAVALTSFRKIWSLHLPHIKLSVKDSISPVKKTHESVSTVSDETDSSSFKTLLTTKKSYQDSESVPLLSDSQVTVPQKTPPSLPYDYNSVDVTHNQTTALNMYSNDGDDHSALQYGYIFSQSSVPMSHHLQTIPNGISPSSIYKRSAQNSPNSAPHFSFPINMASPLKSHVMTNTFNPISDKHLLLLSPTCTPDTNPNQLSLIQYNNKTAMPLLTQGVNTNVDSETQQQVSSSVGSGLTNLSQQIRMAMFQ